MANLLRIRNIAFLTVMVAVASMGQPMLAIDECSGQGECALCDSGETCVIVGGVPNDCDQWDGTGEDCDFIGFCTSTTGEHGVRCECQPCLD